GWVSFFFTPRTKKGGGRRARYSPPLPRPTPAQEGCGRSASQFSRAAGPRSPARALCISQCWQAQEHDSRNGTLWNIGRIAGSLRLNAGGLDHLAPFLGFFGDQPAELGRRSRQRRAAEVSETGLHLRIVESRVDLLVELIDDLG